MRCIMCHDIVPSHLWDIIGFRYTFNCYRKRGYPFLATTPFVVFELHISIECTNLYMYPRIWCHLMGSNQHYCDLYQCFVGHLELEIKILTNNEHYNVLYKLKQRASVCTKVTLLRETDSNCRPLGYEPNELPLLHPAILYLLSTSHSS